MANFYPRFFLPYLYNEQNQAVKRTVVCGSLRSVKGGVYKNRKRAVVNNNSHRRKSGLRRNFLLQRREKRYLDQLLKIHQPDPLVISRILQYASRSL